MTDTPSPAASSTDTVSVDESFWGRFDAERARAGFGFAYFIAVVITAAAVWLVAAAPGATSGTARGSTSQAVLFVLLANLALISGLAFIVGRRVLALARSTGDAGSRLHLRFVALFSMVAVVPAVLIALVFGLLVTRGVDQWFSQNVQASVENGAVVGRAYIRDVATTVDADLVTISDQLDSARGLFDDRIQFNDALAQVGEIFGYPAIYILNGDGQVLARAERPDAPPYLAPPRTYLEDAAQGGEPPTDVTQNPDTVRSIIALPAYGDAYLYLVRPLQDGLVARMNASIQSIEAYREAQESRSRIQSAF
ncbi:MAG: PAS domain-containing sensor histidine kinase, partial [Phenylobacterium sp.]|nr:PAS domain-containing sensor histidine kinase [Phenylobacterium sp.]